MLFATAEPHNKEHTRHRKNIQNRVAVSSTEEATPKQKQKSSSVAQKRINLKWKRVVAVNACLSVITYQACVCQ
jgi:hypothetical protein